MAASEKLLAVIPARGGSKGLPGKNIRPFAGLPLLAHSVLLAKRCPSITQVIVSTDSPEIAQVGRDFGADVPFTRPAELAQDTTALWPVLQHALGEMEKKHGAFDYLALLDPTTPCRLPRYMEEAFSKLRASPKADGIVGVSRPDFNPVWHSVIQRDGWMEDLFPDAAALSRRQDAPEIYRINGSLYIWRTSFVKSSGSDWRRQGKHLVYEVPDFAAISIDNEDEFKRAELFVTSGLFPLPWVSERKAAETCAH